MGEAMRRRPQRANAKVEAKPQVTRNPRDLEQRLAELLRVISSLATNLQPVLDTIATNAVRVCGAYDATVLLREGEFVRRAAHHGALSAR
jgi:two-component system, NtrC family, sensor kinase